MLYDEETIYHPNTILIIIWRNLFIGTFPNKSDNITQKCLYIPFYDIFLTLKYNFVIEIFRMSLKNR